jgi:hypothetical protein
MCGADVVNVATKPACVALVIFVDVVLQCSPPAQNMPQSPQFELSIVGLTHALIGGSHSAGEAAGHAPQTPPVHVWPAAQIWPHAPQLFSSVCVFVQVPEQFVGFCGFAVQSTLHVPAEQTSPGWHGPAS